MKNVKLQIKMQNLNVGTVGAPLVGALNPHPGTGGDKPLPLPNGNRHASGNRNESAFRGGSLNLDSWDFLVRDE